MAVFSCLVDEQKERYLINMNLPYRLNDKGARKLIPYLDELLKDDRYTDG